MIKEKNQMDRNSKYKCNSKNEYKALIDECQITSGEVIAIVGSGGKTSLMLGLAAALAEDYRVLVTTTTHIFKPIGEKYITETEPMETYVEGLGDKEIKPGKIYVYSAKALAATDIYGADQIKLSGVSETVFDAYQKPLQKAFDIILIEADGSRQRPFKAWRDGEPVIPQMVTMTIGVMGVHHLGAPIDERHVHRLAIFKSFLKTDEKYVTKEILYRLIDSPEGMFKNAQGRKILYLAGASDEVIAWFREKSYDKGIGGIY